MSRQQGQRSHPNQPDQQSSQRAPQQPATTAIVSFQATETLLVNKEQELVRFSRGGIRSEMLRHAAIHEMRQNERLAKSTPDSIFVALLACAVAGLEPGSVRGEAFLVPYWNDDKKVFEAKFMAGWRGLQRQSLRSGVRAIKADVVYANDHFRPNLGSTNTGIEHVPAVGPRGALVGTYAWARLPNGEVIPEYLDLDQLEKIRKQAERKNKSDAWTNWPDQMARKSAIRRLCRNLPMGEDYYSTLAIEMAQQTDHDEGGFRELETIDSFTEGAASRARGSVSVANYLAPPPPEAAPAPPAAAAAEGKGRAAARGSQSPQAPTTAPSGPSGGMTGDGASAPPPVSAPPPAATAPTAGVATSTPPQASQATPSVPPATSSAPAPSSSPSTHTTESSASSADLEGEQNDDEAELLGPGPTKEFTFRMEFESLMQSVSSIQEMLDKRQWVTNTMAELGWGESHPSALEIKKLWGSKYTELKNRK